MMASSTSRYVHRSPATGGLQAWCPIWLVFSWSVAVGAAVAEVPAAKRVHSGPWVLVESENAYASALTGCFTVCHSSINAIIAASRQ